MLSNLPFSAPLAAIVAIVPALLRLWWTRGLAPLIGDPAFAERLAAHRQRASKSFGVSVGLLLVLFTDTWLWSIPLVIVSCLWASFPFRRTIHQETWGFAAYLFFIVRAIVSFFGFWLLLIALPWIASTAGSFDWLLGVGLALVLVIWNVRYTDSVRSLLRAKPIENPELVAKFTALAQLGTAGMPRFEQIPLRGGAIANAIALPSLRRSAVLFTDSLLSRLETAEIVAICGHELAHLEYFNRERLRKINLVNMLLIAGSLASVALNHVTLSFTSLAIFWPVVVTITLAWRVRDRQKHETESDLRAVALTGDPEALASGLIKIHAFAHLPRRLDSEYEQHASHPSLARRIKAIRAASPTTPAAAPASATFVSPDGHTQLTFADRHLEWREGEASLHSLSYAHLTELRLRATSPTSVSLRVIERGGRQWTLPIADADIARAQATLDLVDGQLAEAAPALGLWPAVQRVFTLMAVSFAVLVGQVTVAGLALLALARPAAPLLAAAGASLIAGAGLALRESDWSGLDLQPWVSLGLAAFGAMLLWTAWQRREGAPQTMVNRFVTGIGALAGVALVAVLSDGADVIHVHQAARALPAVVVLSVGFAAAIACYSGWRARVSAATAVIVALAMATVGAVPFLDRFGTDPLLLPSETMASVKLTGEPSAEFTLPFYANDVRLSPNGVYISTYDMRDSRVHGHDPTFHVGRLGGPLTPLPADAVMFLDDERVLTLDEDDDGARIEERALADLGTVVWQHRVSGLGEVHLSIDRASRVWRILGWDSEGRVVRVRGTVGQDDDEITRWTSPVEEPGWSTTAAASGSHALIVNTEYDFGRLGGMTVVRAFTMLRPSATVSHLWHLAESGGKDLGTSLLASECTPGAFGDERLVCSAYDGTRTRLVALDPGTGAISAIGAFAGRFTSDRHTSYGLLAGWCDSTPCALRLHTRQLVTFAERRQAVLGFTSSDRCLGVVGVDGSQSKLRLFPLSK